MHGKRSWGAPEDEGELRHRATHSPGSALCWSCHGRLYIPHHMLLQTTHLGSQLATLQPGLPAAVPRVLHTPPHNTPLKHSMAPKYVGVQRTQIWMVTILMLHPELDAKALSSASRQHTRRGRGGACYDNIYGDSGPGCNKAPGITLFTALPLY